VLVRGDKLDEVLKWAGILGKWFEATRHEGIRVLGPAAAPIPRLEQDYRYHFVLKSASREKLNTLLRAMLSFAAQQKIPRTQVVVDVDALWLMRVWLNRYHGGHKYTEETTRSSGQRAG